MLIVNGLTLHKTWYHYLKTTKDWLAELLQRIDAPEIAMELLKEDDYITRSFAAQSLAKHEDLHLKFAEDEHHSVRIIAAENSVDEKLISSLIEDKHSSVRRMAISSAAKNKLKLSSQTLESGLVVKRSLLYALWLPH